MPKGVQRYNYQKTRLLEEVRENAGINIQQMKTYFGKDRGTVRNWELGYQSPQPNVRSDFLGYLVTKLRLEREELAKVWFDVMVKEWQWEPLTRHELWQFFPTPIDTLSNTISDSSISPPFLAPPRPQHQLVGRDNQIHSLKQQLVAGGYIALYGLPGVGKTALALALAYDPEILNCFQDGVLWAGLGPQGDVLTHLGRWGIALGIQTEEMAKKTSIEERVQAIQTLVGMRRLLLVVDDAWRVESALAFKLAGPNCAYIFTTRFPEIALRITLESIGVSELSEDSSLKLLEHLAPVALNAEPNAAQELIQLVGGLPLAIRLIGNYLRVEAFAKQKNRLRSAMDKLKKTEERMQLAEPQAPLERFPSLPVGTKVSLQAVISVSYEALDDTSRHVLRVLSVFAPKPHSFSEEAALQVSTASVGTLNTLCDYGLLERSTVDRYTLHQTIADFARLQLRFDQEPIRRHADYYLNFVQQHSDKRKIIETELSQIAHAWQALDVMADPQKVITYVHTLENFQFQQGLWRDRIAWCNRGVIATRLIGASKDEGALLNQIGWCYRQLGEDREALAYYELALPLRRRIGDLAGEAETLNELGIIYDDLSETDHALDLFKQAVSMWQNLGNRKKEAQALANIGALYIDLGYLPEAVTYFEQARLIYDELQDLVDQAFIYNNIARAYIDLGKSQEALTLFEQALHINRTLGRLDKELHNLNNLGALYREIGEPRKAIEYYEQSLSICKQLGARRNEAFALHNSGVAYMDLGDLRYALELITKALSIRRDIEDRDGQAFSLASIGWTYHLLHMPHDSITNLEQALSIWRDIQNKIGEALGLNRLGRVYTASGQFMQADEYFQQALLIHRLNPYPANEANTLRHMAIVREMQGKLNEAVELLTQAIKIEGMINSPALEQDRILLAQWEEKLKQQTV